MRYDDRGEPIRQDRPEDYPEASSHRSSNPLEPTKLIGAEPSPVAWLAVKSGPDTGRQFNLKRGRNTIGRDSKTCNIALDDETASAEHSRVQFENGQFVIYDLASLNGTFVNGKRVQKQSLMDGDEIRIGNTISVFKQA